MKKIRNLLLLAVVTVALLIPTYAQDVSAAQIKTTPSGYTSAEEVNYVKVGKYVANWGARGETATFLSTYALSFYGSNYDYEYFTSYSGGTSQSNAPQSALYKQLQNYMKSKHTHETSYGETRDQYKYTDCLLSDYSHISSFYSGKIISGTWDSGATWNREHTWPNSKGDASGNGENDIIMLRPTSVSENSGRGNKAYGESGSYYDPGESVRGDCARTMLYVYTRWGNTSSMWGYSGVMENLTVLLKWMREDPVDTWEMGRNDAVQAITGTRNMFVDYPEYAFLLFGEEIPANMPTPSNSLGGTTPPTSTPDDSTIDSTVDSSQDVCEEHQFVDVNGKQPTATEEGFVEKVCINCGTVEREVLPALGGCEEHQFVEVNGKQPTATEEGFIERLCIECGEIEREVLPALGVEDNPNSDITSDGSSDITSEDDITSETDGAFSGEEGSESEENHSSGVKLPQGGNNCKSSVNGSLIMLVSMAVAVAIIFKKESK